MAFVAGKSSSRRKALSAGWCLSHRVRLSPAAVAPGVNTDGMTLGHLIESAARALPPLALELQPHFSVRLQSEHLQKLPGEHVNPGGRPSAFSPSFLSSQSGLSTVPNSRRLAPLSPNPETQP